jgi:heat shock protein HslJ
MKKRLFVLPLCFALAFCSRKTVPPPPVGVSNVKVGSGDTMTSAANASAKFGTQDRDWAYKANRDTALNGTWMLEGMLSSDGVWASTEVRDTINSTGLASTDTAMSVGTSATATTTTTKSSGKKSAGRNKQRNALYAGAQTRLKMQYKMASNIDTTALEPYKYWSRTPSLVINAARAVFTGNTGCNSMSGSFNFSDKDIQFGRNIVTSKMSCNEYDENNFLSLLKRADTYSMTGNRLEIRQGATLLLTFVKS